MNSPTFAVVIPVRDRAELLKRALDSVYTQSYLPAEVIVVDDGSKNSESIESLASQYSNPEITLITYSPGKNAAYARNKGIDAATSDFIALLDSDDFFHPNKLENFAKLIIKNKLLKTDKAILYSQCIQQLNIGEQLIPPRAIKDDENITDYLFCNGGILQTSMLLFPSAFLKNLRFDDSLPKHQDFDLMFRAFNNYSPKVYFISEPMVTWTRNANGRHLGSSYKGDYSLRFLESRKNLFSSKAYKNFMNDYVIKPAARSAPWASLNFLLQPRVISRMKLFSVAVLLKHLFFHPFHRR